LVDLDQLARSQRGLITRAQALECGHTDADLRRAIQHRRWQRVLPGLYATFTGEPTLEQRRLAALLYAGPGAQITGVAALRWHGLQYLPDDQRIHVLVPHRVQRASSGFVRIQRTRDLDSEARAVNGFVVCSVTRAVADACRGMNDLHSVQAIVLESVQRGLTSIASLHEELHRAGNHRTGLLRQAVAAAARGSSSAPEAAVMAAFARSSVLGRVLWNPTLATADGTRLPSPDGWIAEAALAIEVDSREHHAHSDGWQRTLRRHNLLSAAGAMVLHFTPTEIRNVRRIVKITEQAYLERIRSGATARITVLHDGTRS